jgi:hypothetical protein
MHIHIITYISKAKDQFVLYIFHLFKKYGVIVQNEAHMLKIHIWLVYNMTTAYMPMVLYAYHDSTLWNL